MENRGPHIVVLGAGFGGLTFCQRLRSRGTRVTLIDRQNHHLFQPLLYQVAAAGLAAPDIAQPIRSILSDRENVTVLLDTVLTVRLADKTVVCEKNHLVYDYLVLALGGATSYFGHPEWEEFAPGLKSLDDALRIRRHEAGPRLLPQLPPGLSARAQQQLQHMGVEVRTGTRVKNIGQQCVELEGEMIRAANIIWAAGVSASPLARALGVEVDRAGRVKVNPDLSVPGHREVFVIGDMAFVAGKDGQPVPGVSPAAMQMAKHVARIISAEIAQRSPGREARPAFQYWDKGTMATIGRSAAVAKIKRLEFSGFPAWLAWLLVHLIFLIGFRNKIAVLFNWAYSYFTYKRGMRIITGVGHSSCAAPREP